jgi:glycosyltransferase involved in cell wall biosynthesis
MTADRPSVGDRVSVVIATYNRADLLPRAIESALGQSHPPLEVIVIDDGSTDDTKARCAEFGARIKYVRVENGGVSRARNAGILTSTGDWIALLDSDDTWEPDKLQVQLAMTRALQDVEWVISGCEVVDTAGQSLPGPQSFTVAFPLFKDFALEPDPFFARYLQRVEVSVAGTTHVGFHGDFFELLFLGNVVLPSSALIRRDLLDRIGPFDTTLRVGEDTEFFHRAASFARGAVVMSRLVRYRTSHHDSLTAGKNAVLLTEVALRSLAAASGRRVLTPAEREALRIGRRSLLLRLAYAYLSVRDGQGVRRTLRRLSPDPLGRRGTALWAASLLPPSVLRTLHAVKRTTRRLAST